eukprot:14733754-Alexandrium_andersonii.AAC.1
MSEREVGRGSAGIHQGCSWDSRGAESGHKRCTVANADSLWTAWGLNRCKNACLGTQHGFNRGHAISIKT